MEGVDRQSFEVRPLAQISTAWSVVLRSKDGENVLSEEVANFFARYHGAVYRYFLTSLRKPDIAEELAQDFAVRFLRGDFSKVHPDRGRFRDFLRVSLANQLRDHRRRQKLRGANDPFVEDTPDPVVGENASSFFDENCRDELLAQTWLALEQHQNATGQMYHVALKLKAVQVNRSGVELAEVYSELVSSQTSHDAFRKVLERSRRRFGELLLQIVADTLAVATREELERELAELKLLTYCKELL